MKTLLVICLLLSTDSRPSVAPRGEFKALLTLPDTFALSGAATYTRCGSILHLWLRDRSLRSVVIEVGTQMRHLRPVRVPLSTFEPFYPPRPRSPGAGYLTLFLGPDSMLSADTGAVWLQRVRPNSLEGWIAAEVSDSWRVATGLDGHLTATFRAARDTTAEAGLYHGMFCDRPGAEWYDVH
jgi:hypothetical protein